MAGVQHSRASKPAPRRYGTEANPFRAALPNQDTPEAMTGRLSGELPRGASLNFPPAPSSASGELFWADLVALANRREHDALVADALRLRRIQVGNPDARRKLAKAVRRMLVIEAELRA